MKLSAKGYELIRHYEGCRLNAYPDTGGVWTIGYGATTYEDGTPVKKGDVITQERANQLLPNLVAKRERMVERNVTATLTQSKFDSLVSFVYNIGEGAFKASTLLKLLNGGSPDRHVAPQFHRWNKDNGRVLKGLIKRRASEAHLFEHGELELF